MEPDWREAFPSLLFLLKKRKIPQCLILNKWKCLHFLIQTYANLVKGGLVSC